jgi:C_GCAxxG_C_C family probable redox protein
MDDPIQRAENFFEQGYSCSQSLLCAFSGQLGLDEETAIKIASPFGGGIARQGETCGAVTGALMVLGLKFGPLVGDSKETIYAISQDFLRRFQDQHTSIKCKQLIDYDISQPEELQAAREANAFHKTCPELVRSAAEIVKSMLISIP